MVLGTIYEALMIAFALGVWASAGEKRLLRIAGGLLFLYGLLGLAWPFAAMHQRQVLAAGGDTVADTAHLILAGVTVALMFAAMAFGACRVRNLVPDLLDRDDRDPPRIRRLDYRQRVPGGCEPADALGRALGAHQHWRLSPVGRGAGYRSYARSGRRHHGVKA
jgi:hypothetical protein